MSKTVLLLGGHGRISLLMTPLLLQRSWNVTSVIRNPEQKSTILSKGANLPGKLDVLIESLDDVKTESQAAAVLDKVRPDYVIWSAGAGGKGGAARTYAVDRDAAKAYIAAAAHSPNVKKFLMVSYCACRRSRAPWWTDEDQKHADKTNYEVLPDYYKAKIEADELLTALARQREDFTAIDLRPGTLTDDPAAGKVGLGKTRAPGKISREDVADVAVRCLEKDVSGWVDLVDGDEDIGAAIDRIVKDKVDAVDGEDVDAWVQKHKL